MPHVDLVKHRAYMAAYMRDYRKGIVRTPERLPTLNWPADLYGNAAALTTKIKPEDLCSCGCGKPHRQNVTQTLHSAHGAGWNVIYFYEDTCKSRFNEKRSKGWDVT